MNVEETPGAGRTEVAEAFRLLLSPDAAAAASAAAAAFRRRVSGDVQELVTFLGVAALVIVTPGQDTALTIRNTLLGGRRGGFATALGVSTGQACWTAAASAGIAALIVASEPAFTALKLLGAAYLVLLGVQALVAAARGHSVAADGRDADAPRMPPRVAYRQGMLSNLGNPKMAVFFTSLLPQVAGGGSLPRLLALGSSSAC